MCAGMSVNICTYLCNQPHAHTHVHAHAHAHTPYDMYKSADRSVCPDTHSHTRTCTNTHTQQAAGSERLDRQTDRGRGGERRDK
mmetsp:Transcript_36273/g.90569  ORF Transcript_36273/g.90569 Transcript_36273/m.90569 type:complete len:84 (-) Transcript_36273:64-315(-)